MQHSVTPRCIHILNGIPSLNNIAFYRRYALDMVKLDIQTNGQFKNFGGGGIKNFSLLFLVYLSVIEDKHLLNNPYSDKIPLRSTVWVPQNKTIS